MFRPSSTIRQPHHRIVVMQILWMLRDEFSGFGPESRDRLRRIVEIDCEAVGFVVICHEAEYVVIDVAEEMDLGFYAPVELHVCQRRVLVEKAAVPAAHLVVGFHASVLNIVLLQYLRRFFEQLVVDP
jgi:hypothetical protein